MYFFCVQMTHLSTLQDYGSGLLYYGTCCIVLCSACSLSPCILFAGRVAHRSREITRPCLNLIGPQNIAMACVCNGELGSSSGCSKRYISWFYMLRDCWINSWYIFKKLHYALGIILRSCLADFLKCYL